MQQTIRLRCDHHLRRHQAGVLQGARLGLAALAEASLHGAGFRSRGRRAEIDAPTGAQAGGVNAARSEAGASADPVVAARATACVPPIECNRRSGYDETASAPASRGRGSTQLTPAPADSRLLTLH